jgi:HlyD family secretion protein
MKSNISNRAHNLFKNRKIVISAIVILILAVAGYDYFFGAKAPVYNFVVAQKKNISQEVSVTGSVKPAEAVALSFETGGKIIRVDAEVGDKVAIGQALASINDAETRAQLESASAQLGQYQAAYERELARLNEMKSGTRPEEIKIAETAVANAKKSLSDAKINLQNAINKAQADISQVYDGAMTAAAKSVTVATNSIFTAIDIQTAHFSGNTEDANRITEAKSGAIFYLLGGQNISGLSKNAIGQLNGGAKARVETAQFSPTDENIDMALSELKNALQKTKILLDAIPVTGVLTSAESANLSAEKTNINNEIISIAAKQTSITVQKAANAGSAYTAQTAVNSAENTLASAEDSLALKKSGSTPEQINAQEAQVKQALANINSQKAQIKQAETRLSQTIIRSPINGVVTKQNAKIGQIIAANALVVSVISEKKFQIEANIAEADIAKVAIGNQAKITLDAYGSDINFSAEVAAIDPAETVVEGVSTYKTTLEFKDEDGRLKSGMTANIDIRTASRENVIAISQRLVITQGENKFVKILNKDGALSDVNVKTGLRDSEGNIEITEGISEGDKLIISLTQ